MLGIIGKVSGVLNKSFPNKDETADEQSRNLEQSTLGMELEPD